MTDYYEITTPAATLPMSLAEAKKFLRVDNSADDSLIEGLLSAAINQGEKYTNRVFIERTITGYFSGFDLSQFERYPFITLRRSPLKTINSVKVMLNDTLQDIPAADYQLKKSSAFARILFLASISADDVPYPVEVGFDVGYGNPGAVPEDIKTAIKQHALFLYENRGDVQPEGGKGVPVEVKAMYSKYRILNTYG